MKLEASFDCEECDGEAFSAEYDTSSCRLDYLNLLSRTSAPVPAYAQEAVKAALKQRNARSLFANESDYVKGYCVACDKLYCAEHWEVFTIFEDGGWCDGFILTCPAGHWKEV